MLLKLIPFHCYFVDDTSLYHCCPWKRVVALDHSRQSQIKVKSPATVTEFTPTGLRFADGSELEAGAIVFCTGFHTNMLPEAVKILGTSMKSQLENFWGIDQEGELRGAFKKMKRECLFIMQAIPLEDTPVLTPDRTWRLVYRWRSAMGPVWISVSGIADPIRPCWTAIEDVHNPPAGSVSAEILVQGRFGSRTRTVTPINKIRPLLLTSRVKVLCVAL